MNIFRINGSGGGPLIEETADRIKCPACSKLSIYIDDEVKWHETRCGLANLDKLSRIHIVGGPGSGKTTLAHRIGSRLGIEVHELDSIAFTDPDYAERRPSERLAEVSTIACQPAWITEGLFINWTEALLEYADIIVWLDQVSWGKSMWRTILRFVKSALREAKHRQGLERFTRFHDYGRHLSQLIHVFFSSRAYYAHSESLLASQIESRQNTAKRLASYKDKVIHCYSDEGIKAFLSYISYCCNN